MQHLSTIILALLGLTLATIAGFGFMSGSYLAWLALILLALLPWLHNRIMAKRYLTWKEAYSVGIQTLDDDHKRLLYLINTLDTAVHYQTDIAFERQALNEVVDYTQTHFAREEKLMQTHQYPDYPDHKKQHEAMIAKVNEFVQHYDSDRDGTIEELLNYLREWLIHHIQGTDQNYSGHLTSRGVH